MFWETSARENDLECAYKTHVFFCNACLSSLGAAPALYFGAAAWPGTYFEYIIQLNLNLPSCKASSGLKFNNNLKYLLNSIYLIYSVVKSAATTSSLLLVVEEEKTDNCFWLYQRLLLSTYAPSSNETTENDNDQFVRLLKLTQPDSTHHHDTTLRRAVKIIIIIRLWLQNTTNQDKAVADEVSLIP